MVFLSQLKWYLFATCSNEMDYQVAYNSITQQLSVAHFRNSISQLACSHLLLHLVDFQIWSYIPTLKKSMDKCLSDYIWSTISKVKFNRIVCLKKETSSVTSEPGYRLFQYIQGHSGFMQDVSTASVPFFTKWITSSYFSGVWTENIFFRHRECTCKGDLNRDHYICVLLTSTMFYIFSTYFYGFHCLYTLSIKNKFLSTLWLDALHFYQWYGCILYSASANSSSAYLLKSTF